MSELDPAIAPTSSDWRFKLQMEQSLQAADLAAIKADLAGLVTSVRALADGLSARGRTPWAILFGGAGVLLTLMIALVGAAWFTINLNTQSSLSPITANQARIIENQKSHDDELARIMSTIEDVQRGGLQSSLADVQSRTDRTQLNNRVTLIETKQAENLADRKSETAALAERSAEVETQFRAEDRIRNIQFAEQQRWNAILWARLYPGVPYPAIAYFPEMAQGAPAPLGK